MQIYGTSQIHAAQPLSAPHKLAPASAPTSPTFSQGVDQLDLSPQAELINQVHELPDIRADRVAQLKAQIASGTYETEAKLSGALSNLLDEIG